MGELDKDTFIQERSSAIRERIMAALYEVFEDEQIGAKGISPLNGNRGVRLSFRDGIGFDVTIAEAYRPNPDWPIMTDIHE